MDVTAEVEGIYEERVYLRPTCQCENRFVQIDSEFVEIDGLKYIKGFTVSCAECLFSFGIVRPGKIFEIPSIPASGIDLNEFGKG